MLDYYDTYTAPPLGIRGKIKPDVYRFWCRYLFSVRLRSVFKWELPDTWDEDYLFYYLFHKGYLPCVTTEFGGLPLDGTLEGYNPFHRPAYARVINRGEGWNIDVKGKIGEDCVILAPFTNYTPELLPIIATYAYSLANMSTSLEMSILNSRVAYAFAARDKASAKTIQDIMDKVYNGQPAVTYTKLLGRPDDHGDGDNWNYVELHPDTAYLADKMIPDREALLREFDTIIGLPNVPQKKERMLTDEVDTQNSGNFSIAEKIVDTLNKQFEEVNRIFGLKASVSLNKKVGESDNAGNENNASRNVDSEK